MIIDANAILASAERLRPEIIADRRMIHQHPEVGSTLPATTE